MPARWSAFRNRNGAIPGGWQTCETGRDLRCARRRRSLAFCGRGGDRLIASLPSLDQEPGCSLEVFNAVGETLAVVTVRESQIEPLTSKEVLRVRRLEQSPA